MTLEKALECVDHDFDVIYMTNTIRVNEFSKFKSTDKWESIAIFICRKKELVKSDIYESIKGIEIQIEKMPFCYLCVDVDNRLNDISNIKNHICTYSC